MAAAPRFIPIPARTQPSPCRGCGELFYWAPHPSTGRRHPVSIAEEGCEEPTPLLDGQGVSHFSNCPNAEEFRGGQRS